jgi:hypothetical protein
MKMFLGLPFFLQLPTLSPVFPSSRFNGSLQLNFAEVFPESLLLMQYRLIQEICLQPSTHPFLE